MGRPPTKDHAFNEFGYSLAEIMIATAITAVVTLLGFQAYTFLNKETKDRVAELNSVQQFNLLTKDLLSFSESAGLSTLYLNVPVPIKNCEEGKPCLRQLKRVLADACTEGADCASSEKWLPVPEDKLPHQIKNQKCVQFYTDNFGQPENKKAFPDTEGSTEMVARFHDFSFTSTSEQFHFTWPLENENSTPLILLKVRNIGHYFSLNPGMSFSRDSLRSAASADVSLRAAVFDSNMTPAEVKLYEGYPVLFYGSQNQGHFAYYFISSVSSCRENRDACLEEIATKIYTSPSGGELPASMTAKITDSSYVLGLRPIEMDSPFFSDFYDRLNVPEGTGVTGCQYSWGGTQDPNNFLFPNGLLSVFDPSSPASDANPDARNYYNPTLYNKYAAYEMPGSSNRDPYGQLIPVDIIRYSVEKIQIGEGKERYDLVAQLWHATNIKKLVKISKLSAPFLFTRKLGTSEIGMEYSPKDTSEGGATAGDKP